LSLAERCRHAFTESAVRWGSDYFQQGRVKILDDDDYFVIGEVQDPSGQEVEVLLQWTYGDLPLPGILVESDTEEGPEGPCNRHVWALILTCDRYRFDRLIPGTGTLEVLTDFDKISNKITQSPQYVTLQGQQLAEMVARGATPESIQELAGNWQVQLAAIEHLRPQKVDDFFDGNVAKPLKRRRAVFHIDAKESEQRERLVIQLLYSEIKKNGELGKPKGLSYREAELALFDDEEDRALLALLAGSSPEQEQNTWSPLYPRTDNRPIRRCLIAPSLYETILPRLCKTGRLYCIRENTRGKSVHLGPLAWDDGAPWHFSLTLDRPPTDSTPKRNRMGLKSGWQLTGELRQGEKRLPLNTSALLLSEGLIIFEKSIARLDPKTDFGWVSVLGSSGPIHVTDTERDELLERLWTMPQAPEVSLPTETPWQQVHLKPKPEVIFAPLDRHAPNEVGGTVRFTYDDQTAAFSDQAGSIVDRVRHRVIIRDRDRERELVHQLVDHGLRPAGPYLRGRCDMTLPSRLLPRAVPELIAAGWYVEAEGQKVRKPGEFSFAVTSNLDWFELSGEVDFEGQRADLPTLLKALERGERLVRLGDGSHGMLPEEWLAKYTPLASLGQADGEKLKFVGSQAAILDALLASQPSVDTDENFRRVRDRLRAFDGVKPLPEPESFQGELRTYQREGLGWLEFLHEFRFGGCLADDMGLGKTIQVLAMLERRRLERVAEEGNGQSPPRQPSLVVVPRSLVHNWVTEAGRFTPELRVLDYTGLHRGANRKSFGKYDLIVTTYGTLRRDILKFKNQSFEYAILDEAQAIKNPQSQAAKACRLIKANHRLAMTGTPVENHLGELWSLFEFLNPGMLGASSGMRKLVNNGESRDETSIKLLGTALRPFLLRRTKEQVLTELPEKLEQTLFCDLGREQRRLYDELRQHYQTALMAKVAKDGLAKSKIQVLEALLRLRQAACHPGLIDISRSDEPSAKLELLIQQLQELTAEGHKALVFSQFVKLLTIVRSRLDEAGVKYEYLDGQTRDRAERVDRFQNDPHCPLFLISLKAGGLGLNLTAADYVFILDPWWNPAVEAQAVDRAHRLGQTRRVFAYRLIARETVEEKILELQRQKQDLADAIISEDNSVLANLSADDLTMLLS
jgi:superfamily II DNA or RNA helicase